MMFYVASFIDDNSYTIVLSSSELEKYFLLLDRFKISISAFLLIYVQKLIYREHFVDLMVFLLKPYTDVIIPPSPFYWCCELIYLSNTSFFLSLPPTVWENIGDKSTLHSPVYVLEYLSSLEVFLLSEISLKVMICVMFRQQKEEVRCQ